MKSIVVTGGSGFLGSRIIESLLRQSDSGETALDFAQIISLDLAECRVNDPRVLSVVGDITDPRLLARAITKDTIGVLHLAAVLSGESEGDFDLAMRVNVDGTRAMLETARDTGAVPRFVFTSSLAVFGGEIPAVVPESFAVMPESTYGSSKAISELLVNEYSRRGFVDGRICRLPTISVRPGRPNSAASSFASGIIREPLGGLEAVCPVPLETRLWLSSPNTAASNIIHALEVSPTSLGTWRAMNLPGLTVTAGEMLDSLLRIGGTDSRAKVLIEENSQIMDIVCSWPGAFAVDSALALGFVKDESFDDIVRQYYDEFVR